MDADEDVDSMFDGATWQICLLQQALYGLRRLSCVSAFLLQAFKLHAHTVSMA